MSNELATNYSSNANNKHASCVLQV